MRSASDAFRGSGQHVHTALVRDRVLLDVRAEVVLVGVFALQCVEDRVLRAQPHRGDDLTELEVEVDDAHPLARGASREIAEIGGKERLPAAAGGRGDREHAAGLTGSSWHHCGGSRGCGGLGDHRSGRLCELDRAIDGVDELLVVHGELQEIDGTGPHDLAQAAVGPPAERKHNAHARELLPDQPEALQSRPRPQARTGDEHVERPVVLEQLAHRTETRAGHDVGARP